MLLKGSLNPGIEMMSTTAIHLKKSNLSNGRSYGAQVDANGQERCGKRMA